MIADATDMEFETKDAPKAAKLQANNEEDLKEAARIIKEGGVAVLPFNGIFGLFGDVDNKAAADKINLLKDRKDKSLITVIPPEYAHELADFDKVLHPRDKINGLWKDLHALGIILPAGDQAPSHLVSNGSIVNIWTEYAPMRTIIEHFREMGGRGLVGTSANRRNQPTHNDPREVWEDFQDDVEAVVQDDFSHLAQDKMKLNFSLKNAFQKPKIDRRKSTSMIDMTGEKPRFHRAGNVDEQEIKDAIKRHGLPELTVTQEVKAVKTK